jgi:RNA 3'-terminal phosphate cyclase (ATP)
MALLTLDGSHGEGGGQILRTALSLSMVTARAFRLVNIRAGRRNPGLLPQHLSAVRAAAAVSKAELSGDQLGSSALEFAPRHAPKSGSYVFDVTETAGRGSAGSVTLILQTLLVPLAFGDSNSAVLLRGGTHVEWSPPFDHLTNSYLPLLRRMGFRIDAELRRFGFYPAGGGEVLCSIAAGPGADDASWLTPLQLTARGPLRCVSGRAVAANLPAHIAQRMADRAHASLTDLGVPVGVHSQRVTAAGPGAGIFLTAEYAELTACFSGFGRLGKPSEAVADEAVAALREHHGSGAAVELHLADQLLLPLALASGPSMLTAPRPTGHLMTNAWVIGQFGIAAILVEGGAPCRVRIEPRNWR